MKRFIFTLSIVLLLVSCGFEDQKPGTATVRNISTNYDVTYKLTWTQEVTKVIEKDSTDTFERPLWADITSYEPSKRISLKIQYPHNNDAIYTFSEKDSYVVRVNNTIGENASLQADGWMDAMVNITPGSTNDANHNGKVYTKTPIFLVTTTSGFPAEASYTFSSDVFMVTIKW